MTTPLSPSRARAFTECPWRFRQTYIRKVPTLSADPLESGSLFHEAAEMYLRHLVQEKAESLPQDVPMVWGRFVSTRPGLINERFYDDLKRLLSRFAHHYRLDLDRLWDVEVQLAVDAEGKPAEWTAPDVFVRGRGDAVFVDGDRGFIHDWKSGFGVLRQGDLENDLQAQSYAMLLSKLNPNLNSIEVAFIYPRFENYRSTWIFRSADFDLAWQRWLEIRAQIEQALAALDDERLWGPTPGAHCAGCPVTATCPIGVEAVASALPVVLDAQGATMVAERLVVLNAVRENLTEALKGWILEHGPVPVNDLAYGFHKSESFDYPVERLVKLAEKHFIDPYKFLSVNSTNLKKAFKKDKGFASDVAAIATDKGSTTFTAKKVKAELTELAEAGSGGNAEIPA